MKAISDIVVAGIYIVFFGLNIALFAMWQKRGQEKPEGEAAKPRTSRFGRPLRRRRNRAGDRRCDGEWW